MPDRSWTPITLGADYPPPAGPYSPAVRAGDFLYVSGQVPRNPVTGELEGTDVASQTRRVIENIRLVLEEGGATLDDVVSITAYLADIADWDTFNGVYREVFRPPYPSRTTLGAQLHGVLVEISAVALVRGE